MLSSGGYIGALVARHGSGGTISVSDVSLSNSSFSPKVSSTGGLIASSQGAVSASRVQVTDLSISTWFTDAVGGVVGESKSWWEPQSVLVTDAQVIRFAVTGDGDNVGGVVGQSDGRVVLNRITVTDIALGVGIGAPKGGIIGRAWSDHSISNARVTGSIFGIVPGVGGAVGVAGGYDLLIGKVSIDSVHTNLSLNGQNGSSGGLFGWLAYGRGDISITRSSFVGSIITTNGSAGGLFGQLNIPDGYSLVLSDSSARGTIVSSSGIAAGALRDAKDMTEAKAISDKLESVLRDLNRSALQSYLEAKEDLLAVHDLKLSRQLKRFFSTTNPIESLNSLIEEDMRRVKRWRDSEHFQRWLATYCLASEKKMRRSRGSVGIPGLWILLRTLTEKNQIDSTVLEEEVA